MPKVNLPVLDETVLDRIDIAGPCSADWNAMRGDETVRHCAACDQNVYDLSTLGRAEAVALIARTEGRLCVRLKKRADGRLVTDECAARLRAARKRGVMPYLGAVAVVGVIHLWLKVAGIGAAWFTLGAGPAHPANDPARVMMGAPPPPRNFLPEPAPPVEHPRMGKPVAPREVMGEMTRRPL